MLNLIADSGRGKKYFKIFFHWLTETTIDLFINEVYSKPPKKNYVIIKIHVCYFDGTWSLD